MKLDLVADMQAPSAARSFVAAHLAGWKTPLEIATADVTLIASELVTNALRAGAGKLALTLSMTRHRVDLTVEDDAAGWPTPRSVTDLDTRGRGLHIVEELTDHWQVTATTIGKAITATWFL